MSKEKEKKSTDTNGNKTETSGLAKLYQPKAGTRASICSWNLSFYFLTKEQCLKFINLYMNKFPYSSFEYKHVVGDSLVKDEHWIIIENYSWAHNLEDVAKLLKKCDYQMDKS